MRFFRFFRRNRTTALGRWFAQKRLERDRIECSFFPTPPENQKVVDWKELGWL